MKLLLTSQSIHNKTIEHALLNLLDKPSKECTVAYITTSQNAAVGDKGWLIENLNNAYDVGWKSFEIIDIAAAIDLPKDMWWDRIVAADVIFVGGGANFYLGYWLEKSGLAKALLKLLEDKVYVGCSAGSMITTKSLLTASQSMEQLEADGHSSLGELGPEGQRSPRSLGIVNFAVRPHYTSPEYGYITDDLLQKAANVANCRIYAIDDNSALKVIDETVEVVSEGRYKVFDPIE
ncbi:MAG TPA: Type 1 glutamine amidotransferase-like domain-containing protein [Candidatus Saccharimonadales bacterium]|nr:Type 1 glutamine amidotransferase-like domain-containing protein [Candidatus Saccharimonadales bacterium]